MEVIVWARRILLVLLGILGCILTICLLVHLSGVRWSPGTVQAVEEQLLFPFEVPGTTLVARDLISYENISAILLENKGTAGISNARVVLQWAEGAYVFDVDMLPPKEKVLVPDRDGQVYRQQKWTKSVGVQVSDRDDWQQSAVLAERVEDTKLKLTNTLDVPLREVYIYYKSKLPKEETLFGTQVRRCKVGDLQPGEEIYLEPFGFSWEDCKIVRISSQEEY